MKSTPMVVIEQAIDDLGEREFFKTLFLFRGVVYGGFLRDALAGVTPRDIDVVVSQYYVDGFETQMRSELGYVSEYNPSNETTVWRKAGHMDVESYSVEDHPDEVIIGPESDPDFDVNILVYDGTKLRSWVDPSMSLFPIIEHIETKTTVQLGDHVSQDRVDKIIRKGYTII